MIVVKGTLSIAQQIVTKLGRVLSAVAFSCNGSVRRDAAGQPTTAVLGVNTGLWAAKTFGKLAKALGAQIAANPKQVVFTLTTAAVPYKLVACRTKRAWHGDSSMPEIEAVVTELIARADAQKWETVVIPAFGTGSGKLPRKKVISYLKKQLDDRFIMLDNTNSEQLDVEF